MKEINLTLDEAEELAKETDYYVFVDEGNENINIADAGAFFLEGFNYARELISKASSESQSVRDNEQEKEECNHKWKTVGPPGEILIYCEKCKKPRHSV